MKRIFLTMMLVLGMASLSIAAPIMNTANDGIEDRFDGSVFSMYQNSGALVFTQSGNTSESAGSVADLQTLLNAQAGFGDVVLSVANVNYTAVGDGSSGTWASDPVSNTIEFYTVKAGDYFALYYLATPDSTGSWSTFDIWSIGGPGTGGHPRNGGGGLEVSHFIGYNPSSTPVPEPGTVILLGAGLVGLGLYGRRRMKIQG